MKLRAAVFVLLLACTIQSLVVAKSTGDKFGPGSCIALSRSAAGSCVIQTNCLDQDISQTEFAFNCIGEGGAGGIFRHSFGVGGFDVQEEFDTEVKCDRCGRASPMRSEQKDINPSAPPQSESSVPDVSKVSRDSPSSLTAIDTHQHVNLESDVVKYGPNSCVSTYKNEEGHCIMQTACRQIDTSDYNFGLVCVGDTGSPVRHLFGRDSFDPEETFDTQISCDQCLGLQDVPDTASIDTGVETMVNDLSSLQHMMQDITMQVKRLNAKVFAKRASFMQAGEKTNVRVHGNVRHHARKREAKRRLRHAHKKHRHRRRQ